MIEKFLSWSTKAFKKPFIIIAIAVIITAFFAIALPSIKFDNNIKTMIPKNNIDIRIQDYYEDESRFGSSALIYFGIETNKIDGAYELKTLQYVKKIKDEIENLNLTLPQKNLAKLFNIPEDESRKVIDSINQMGINKSNYETELIPVLSDSKKMQEKFGWDAGFADKIQKAVSKIGNKKSIYDLYEIPVNKTECLVNADYIAYEEDSLVVKKIIPDEELTPENIEGLKERTASWNMYQDTIVSRDGKLTTIFVKLNSTNNLVVPTLNSEIYRILKENNEGGFEIYTDGETIITDNISKYMHSDMMVLMPAVVLVVLLILFLCFRNFGGVALPSAVMLLSLIWSLGLMSYLNVPLTVVGVAMPVLLVAIASAYGIHIMNHYYLDTHSDKLTILSNNMNNVGLAIMLSGIAIMIGFGALAAEDFVPIKNFGIYTAVGAFVGVFAALYFLPSLLLVSKRPKTHFSHESSKDWIGIILKSFVAINKNHSKKVFIISIAICVIFAVGLPFVKSELNNISFFKKSDPIRIADDKLNEKLAGTQVLNIIMDSNLDPIEKRLDGKTDGSGEIVEITTPEILNKIEQFSTDIEKEFPGIVKKVTSFNDIIKKLNLEMNEGKPEFYAIPQNKDLINQYLLIFSGDIKSVLSPNHDMMKISINMNREKAPSEVVEKVRQYSLKYFSDEFKKQNHISVYTTGYGRIYYVANRLLVNGTMQSIVICIIVVFILLLIVLRNFWISLVAMIPIFITLVINFGIFGVTNLLSMFFPFIDAIPLNVGTAMVSSIAIGIGVDYSIHYITWYRNEMRKHNGDITVSLEETIMHKGRAILYNMFVIFGGFLVLALSRFVPLIQFGSLVALCMVTTAIGALVIVPAVMRGLVKRNFKFLYMGIEKDK
jgi:uncharacterized protein